MDSFYKTGVVQSPSFYESSNNLMIIFDEGGSYVLEEDGTVLIDESSTENPSSHFAALFGEDWSYLLEEDGTIIADESSTDDTEHEDIDTPTLSGQAMSMTNSYIVVEEFIEY
jgi:hypothetical protein